MFAKYQPPISASPWMVPIGFLQHIRTWLPNGGLISMKVAADLTHEKGRLGFQVRKESPAPAIFPLHTSPFCMVDQCLTTKKVGENCWDPWIYRAKFGETQTFPAKTKISRYGANLHVWTYQCVYIYMYIYIYVYIYIYIQNIFISINPPCRTRVRSVYKLDNPQTCTWRSSQERYDR